MTATIRETIIQAVATVLAAVPGIPAANVLRDDNGASDVFPRLVLQETSDDPVDQSSFGVDICKMHLQVIAFVEAASRSAADVAAMSAALDVLIGQAKKLLAANPRVGGAFDLAIGEGATELGDDPDAKPSKATGFAVSIDYHTKAGDPFTAAY